MKKKRKNESNYNKKNFNIKKVNNMINNNSSKTRKITITVIIIVILFLIAASITLSISIERILLIEGSKDSQEEYNELNNEEANSKKENNESKKTTINENNIDEDKTTQKETAEAILNSAIKIELYDENGKKITSNDNILESEYITISINKEKIKKVISIRVFDSKGNEITDKAEKPVGDENADASFIIKEKGTYTIEITVIIDGKEVTKKEEINVDNLPETQIEKLQGSSKLYTLDGDEIKKQKHAKEVLTLKLININSYDNINIDNVKLIKKATTTGEKNQEIEAIKEDGQIKIIGDNTYKTGVASYEITSNGIYEATISASKSGITKSTTFDVSINNIEIATPSIETTQTDVEGYTTRKRIIVKVANKEKFDSTTISIDKSYGEEINTGSEARYIVNQKGTYTISVEGIKDGIKNTAKGTIEVSELSAPTPTMEIIQNEIDGYTTRKKIIVKVTNKNQYDNIKISIDKKLAEESNTGEEASFIVNENGTYTISVEGTKDGMKNTATGTIELKDLKAPTPTIEITQSDVDGYTTRKRITVELTNKENFDSTTIGISEKLEEESNDGKKASFIVDKNQIYTITVVGEKEKFKETYTEDTEVKELVAPTPTITIDQEKIKDYTTRKRIVVFLTNHDLFDTTTISIDEKISEDANDGKEARFTVNQNKTYTVTAVGTKDGMSTSSSGQIEITDLQVPTPMLEITQNAIEGFTTRKMLKVKIKNKDNFDSANINIDDKIQEQSNSGTEANFVENKNKTYTITSDVEKEGFKGTFTEKAEINDLAAPIPKLKVEEEKVDGYSTRKRIKVKIENQEKYDTSEIKINEKLTEESNDGKEASFIVDKNQLYIITAKGVKEGYEATYSQNTIIQGLEAPTPTMEITQSNVDGYTTRKRITVKLTNKEKFDETEISINEKMREENNNGEEANFIVNKNQTYIITVKGKKDNFEKSKTSTIDITDLKLEIPAIKTEQDFVEGYTTRKRINVKLTNDEKFDKSTIEISSKMSEESNDGKEANFIVNKNQGYLITVNGEKDGFNTTYTEKLLITGIAAAVPTMQITTSEVEGYTTRKRITVKITNLEKFDLTTINIDKKIEEESNNGKEANFIVNENGKYTIGVLGEKDDNNNNATGIIEIKDLKAVTPIVSIEQENVDGYTTRKRIKVRVTNKEKYDSVSININKKLKQEKNTGTEADFIVNENQTYTITVVGKKESFSATYTGNVTVANLASPIPIMEITTSAIEGWTTRKNINVKVTNIDKYDTATISIDKKISEESKNKGESSFVVNENGKYAITVNVDKDGLKNSATGTIDITDLMVATPTIVITQSSVDGYTTRKRITVKVTNRDKYDTATISINEKMLEESNNGEEANFIVNKNQKYTIDVTGKKESFSATYTEETTVSGLEAAVPTMKITTSSVEGYTTRKRITVKITNTDKYDKEIIGIDKKILEESNTGKEANFIVNENRKYTITVVGIKDGLSSGTAGTIDITDLKAPTPIVTITQSNVDGYTTRKRITVKVTNKDKFDSASINISEKMSEESNTGTEASFIVNKNQDYNVTVIGNKESFSSKYMETTTISGLVAAVPTMEITTSSVEGYTTRKRITVKITNTDKFDTEAIGINNKLLEEKNTGKEASFIVCENKDYNITIVGIKDGISNGTRGVVKITDLKAPMPTVSITQSNVDGYTSRKRIKIDVTNKDKYDSSVINISDRLTEESNTGTSASYIVNKNQDYDITVTATKDNFTSTYTEKTTISGLKAPTPILSITQSNVEGYTTRKRITATITNKNNYDSLKININNKLEEESNNGKTANFIVNKNQDYTITAVGQVDGYSNTSTGNTTVTGLSLAVPTLSITQSNVDGYTTRKRITVNVTNKEKFDSADISIDNKLSQESNTGTEANFIVNRNQEYTITVVGHKDGFSTTNTGKTIVSALGAEVPTVTITQSNVNGYTSRKRITVKVTNNNKFDSATISIDNKLSEENNTGTTANFIVNKNQTYRITVIGEKDGFNATYTGNETVSGLTAPTPTVTIEQEALDGYTTRKKIKVKISNKDSFDSSTISMDDKLTEDSNDGKTATYTVNKNKTYTITVTGKKDNFTSTYTGNTIVSDLKAPAINISVTNTVSSDKKKATINSSVTNASLFDSISSFTESYDVTKNGTYTTTVTGTKDGFTSTGTGSTTVSGIDISSYSSVTISGSKSQSSLPASLTGAVKLYDNNASGKYVLNSSSSSLGTNQSSYSNSFSSGSINISLPSGGTYYLHTLISDGQVSTEKISGPITMSVTTSGGNPVYHSHTSSCYSTGSTRTPHTHTSSCYTTKTGTYQWLTGWVEKDGTKKNRWRCDLCGAETINSDDTIRTHCTKRVLTCSKTYDYSEYSYLSCGKTTSTVEYYTATYTTCRITY